MVIQEKEQKNCSVKHNNNTRNLRQKRFKKKRKKKFGSDLSAYMNFLRPDEL